MSQAQAQVTNTVEAAKDIELTSQPSLQKCGEPINHVQDFKYLGCKMASGQESLDIVKKQLFNNNMLADCTDLCVNQVMSSLEYCLTTTCFQYDGQFYQHFKGADMGSLVPPITTNLFMEDFKTKSAGFLYPTRRGSPGTMSMVPLW